MTKEKTIFILGIWIVCLPYLGFPHFWKNILFVLSGMFMMLVSYLMYRHKQVLDRIINEKYETSSSSTQYTTEEPVVYTPPYVHPAPDIEQVEVRPRRRITRRKVIKETLIHNVPEGIEVITQTSTEEDPLR